MEYVIKNKVGEKLARISFGSDNKPIFLDTPNKEFEDFLKKSVENGIEWIRDVYSSQENSNNLVVDQTDSSNSNFPLALKEFLERSGYQIAEQHPEVQEEIKKLLAEFPNDNPDKIDILARLPNMSYLEETAILNGLKKIQSEYE